jgi:AraC-like DNA-binding protein
LISDKFALCTWVLGFFMAFPLMILGRTRPANFWLGLFVFSMSCACLAEVAFSNGWYRRYPYWAGIFDWPVAAIAPAYYCYVRALTAPCNWRRQIWHLLPALLFGAALFLPRLLRSPPVDDGQQLRHVSHVIGVAIPILMGLSLIYAAAVWYRLRQFKARLREAFSSTEGRDLQWLVWLTAAIVAVLAAWVLGFAVGGIWQSVLDPGRLALLYFVGWYGLRQAPVFQPAIEATTGLAHTSPAALVAEAAEAPGEDKYSRSGMTQSASQLIGARLSKRNRVDKDYLEGDLKLLDLAKRIGTSSHLLSQYLNQEVGCNFFDYINGLRVAEVQDLMRDASNATRSLLELAHAAGFNSKSHFNASFSKVSGMTPSAWRRVHAAHQERSAPLAHRRAI